MPYRLPILALLAGCYAEGERWVGEASYEGPAIGLDAASGEVLVPLVLTVEPREVDGSAGTIFYGFDANLTFTARDGGFTVVRVLVDTEDADQVPSAWDVDVTGEASILRRSDEHRCGRKRCEALYDVILDNRDAGIADLAWTVDVWAYGKPGSLGELSDDTALTATFGEPR